MKKPMMIEIDNGRDAHMTASGKATLKDRYLLPGETVQLLFGRVASYYSSDSQHGQRIYDYMSNHWFMPATPILSNGGTGHGLPISCFLNETEDSLKSIMALWQENVSLSAKGGGIGSYWGNVRSLNEKMSGNGKCGGVIPFIHVQNSLSHCVSQGGKRNGSAAVYLPVNHPEIEEFISIRKPTGGAPERKAINLHNGIVVDDLFMEAVVKNLDYDLISPKTKKKIRSVKARDIWTELLLARMETGEPYILFKDTVNRLKPDIFKTLQLEIKTSNLCSEITLPTGRDHHGKERTAVCCLSSLNLEKWDEWKDHPTFIEDVMRFLDNVIQDFIDNAPDELARARYSAMRERSVGLGVMGFHSYLQSKMVPFESAIAVSYNKAMFSKIKSGVDAASRKLAEELGACPDSIDAGELERFVNKTAIAPTASISIICGGASPGIEPFAANAYTQKTLSGSLPVRNRYLDSLIRSKIQEQGAGDVERVWSEIVTSGGSIQHMDFFTDDEKLVFKTAREIDQRWVIDLAADRAPMVDQAQSINVFLPANVSKKYLSDLHYRAWKKGLKSLYYCRSNSVKTAERVSDQNWAQDMKYEECLSCQ